MEDGHGTLVAGYRLDRYELLAPIASGGMASVWLAQLRGKRGFEKLFAIKTIKTELTTDSRFQEMFLDEARIASGIQHPNVAQILDLGEQDDILYIVMEWVDGDSLAKVRTLAKKGGVPVPLGIVLRIVSDACAGLHAAHELRDRQGRGLGVVHRDVSPQNILVSSAGSVKVIDFGVAKARDRHAGETGTGVVKGKLRYMAPEQAQGHAVDRRADIWAVGACLLEILTGALPFEGDSDVDVLRRLMGDEPPARAHGKVGKGVEEILAHSLVRDPNERFSTAAAMQRALEAAIDELGVPSTNEDVADYLRANMLDLETKRREAVERALSASASRDGGKSKVIAAVADDPALAPTAVVERGSAARPIETKEKKKPAGAKRKRPRAEAAISQPDDSKVTPTATLTPSAPSPPKRGGGVWWMLALVAAGAGAWFVWPGGARLQAMLGLDEPAAAPAASVSAAPAAEPNPRPSASVASTPPEGPSPSVVASVAPPASAPPSAATVVGVAPPVGRPPPFGRPPPAPPKPPDPTPAPVEPAPAEPYE